MLQLIVFIIFLVSAAGAGFILFRKITVLVTLPKNGHHGIRKPEIFVNFEKKLREHHFNWVAKKMLLQKFLSKIRVLILKAERKVDTLLHSIRQQAQELDKQVKRKR